MLVQALLIIIMTTHWQLNTFGIDLLLHWIVNMMVAASARDGEGGSGGYNGTSKKKKGQSLTRDEYLDRLEVGSTDPYKHPSLRATRGSWWKC